MKGAFYLLLVLLTSCGYHAGQGELASKYSTITIPYVEGDEYGELTAVLVKEISRTGTLSYQRSYADLSLNVSIIDCTYDNIGFRYDQKHNSEPYRSSDSRSNESNHSSDRDNVSDDIIPVETRAQVIAEVSITECATGALVLGPVQIRATLDFDHDYYYSRHYVNNFSMGQLTDYDSAVDGSFKPLYTNLAHKIADYVYDSW